MFSLTSMNYKNIEPKNFYNVDEHQVRFFVDFTFIRKLLKFLMIKIIYFILSPLIGNYKMHFSFKLDGDKTRLQNLYGIKIHLKLFTTK